MDEVDVFFQSSHYGPGNEVTGCSSVISIVLESWLGSSKSILAS